MKTYELNAGNITAIISAEDHKQAVSRLLGMTELPDNTLIKVRELEDKRSINMQVQELLGKLFIIHDPDAPIMTNDIKKGERIVQRNGWEAKILDNMKGITRIAEVYGDFTESGSIYSHDILAVHREGAWLRVTHTEKQISLRQELDEMGF